MPIREYCCNSCGRVFEELIRNDKEERDLLCPACGSSGIIRVFSVFGVTGTEKRVYSSGNRCSHCSSYKCSSCS